VRARLAEHRSMLGQLSDQLGKLPLA
jgi:hypothetical protein